MDWIKNGLSTPGVEWLSKRIGNKLTVSSIPFEAHLPGYQFCGPGTKYDERVAKGQTGINSLDNACMKHDSVYNSAMDKTDDNRKRRAAADDELINSAKQFRKQPGIGVKDKLSAYAAEGAMRVKRGLGLF